MTASWGQGITSSPKEGLASGELVTWRSQPKRVPIPLEEAKQTPLGQVWVRAADRLGQPQPLSVSLGGSCSWALVCQEGASKETNILWAPSGHQARCQPYDIITIINIVLLNQMLGHHFLFSKTVDCSPFLGNENSLVGDK